MPKTAKSIPARPQMRPSEIILALKLARDGLTQTQIAQRLARDQSTISSLLSQWSDSRELAKEKLNTSALKLAERVIDRADVDQSLEVLDRIGVAEKRQAGPTAGAVQIVIGMPGHPAGPDPMSPVNVITNYQTQRKSAALTSQSLSETIDGGSE